MSKNLRVSWVEALVAICLLVGGSDKLLAQSPSSWPSSIRCWGKFKADTEGRDGTFIRVAAGHDVTGVLRADGRILVNGDNSNRQCQVPTPPAGLDYVDLAVRDFGLGLLSDGSIVVWGSVGWVPPAAPALPPGPTRVHG